MCICHRLVCREHVADLSFEEPLIGIIVGTCSLCGKKLTHEDDYSWVPIDVFSKLWSKTMPTISSK